SYRLFETGRRHQRLELVGTIDNHEHPRAGLARLLEPAREQGDVETDQHVGRLDGLERALAASDGLDPDLGPRRHGIDAHLVCRLLLEKKKKTAVITAMDDHELGKAVLVPRSHWRQRTASGASATPR